VHIIVKQHHMTYLHPAYSGTGVAHTSKFTRRPCSQTVGWKISVVMTYSYYKLQLFTLTRIYERLAFRKITTLYQDKIMNERQFYYKLQHNNQTRVRHNLFSYNRPDFQCIFQRSSNFLTTAEYFFLLVHKLFLYR
jgi:hypothetical protein